MNGQLHEFSDGCQASGQFASRLQQLMGADFEPDPSFLEEAWTLGLPVAAENWHRRRDGEDRNRQSSSEQNTPPFFSSADWVATSVSMKETQAAWTPQAWTPLDRAEQRWIPHGWMPQGWAPRDEEPHSHNTPAASLSNNTDADHACTILGVSPGSAREQIRSAYRRKVSQCHPDRLHGADHAVRQLATEQMAELNQAYRLLCDLLPQRAA